MNLINLMNKHKSVTERVKEQFGLSNYAMMWIAFGKGVALGCLLMHCLSG